MKPVPSLKVREIAVSALEPKIRAEVRDDALVLFSLGRGKHLATQRLE